MSIPTPINGGGGSGGTPNPPATSASPSIVTSALPAASIGTAYTTTLVVSGGTAPFSWAITAGALPTGLALAAATGIISGVPTVGATFAFVVTVTDANAHAASLALDIAVPTEPIIQQTSLPAGSVGIPYAAALSGSGGSAPYGFQLTVGTLPEGLALATTGGITGLPTTAGTFTFTVQIYDSNDPQGINTQQYSITIAAAQLSATERIMDAVVLVGAADGGLYAITPGQRHDTTLAGDPVGFLQRWESVCGQSAKLGLLKPGGASIGAKGNGNLHIGIIDDLGNPTPLTTQQRPMILTAAETNQDFMVKAVPEATRFALVFDNGGVADAHFELHVAMLYVRPTSPQRKA